ncbi:uncharacterized protein PGTG_15752 [Puccinia graminis f. sp. tritici CRL 75-36-700-3]|uniref:Uncharacterized protein n=1 Tax=Puccinia graminis f. sp. tritici (strain CRL 75-36-700-3 / race SCCL) TaxID=418459 RepID=E3L013_PUCGT|nr:uncharacterized protein PGTG_15752 [Puccinia graminis f. sp. tritici CRL 75-36-700-3]EFP89796.2 hypothetical protein PGTG_15752 [Puccinia graminis f. sp. tritici CRL 75-36-700-3]
MIKNNKQVAFCKILSDFLSKITPDTMICVFATTIVLLVLKVHEVIRQLKQLKDEFTEKTRQLKEQIDHQWALNQLEKMLAQDRQDHWLALLKQMLLKQLKDEVTEQMKQLKKQMDHLWALD